MLFMSLGRIGLFLNIAGDVTHSGKQGSQQKSTRTEEHLLRCHVKT